MRENNNPTTDNIYNRNCLRQRICDKNSDFLVTGDNAKCAKSHPRKSPPTQLQKIGSALFYAVCSICIVFVNKSVLTIYHFPSAQILGMGQMIAALLILGTLKAIGKVDFPDFSKDIPKRVFPLPILYLCNMVFGLMSTQSLSLPMFTVLRRFSILMTMILEKYILGNEATRSVTMSVLIMIFGALVAASNDLAFDLHAYFFILCNDAFTASYGVYTKKSLNHKDLGKYGLLFYNSLLSLPLILVVSYFTGDIQKAIEYEGWGNPMFFVQFSLSCFMGFILMYAIVLCTFYNSSLTTTVTGCMKNLIVTYVGMFLGGDYIFSMVNFMGINISVAGSLIYSYYAFRSKQPKVEQTPENEKLPS